MLVEPAFLRSELLSNDSTTYAQPTIDGSERTKEIVAAWKSMDGKQGGDPAKLAVAVVTLVGLKERPVRFAAGADAVTGRSRPRPTRCSHRPKPTAIFPPHSPTMTLDHE